MLGMTAGSMIGHLARRSFGQYDLPIPRPLSDELAFASALLSGYRYAEGRGHDLLHKVAFAFIVAFTVYVTLDIEYPRLGFVRLDAIDQLLVGARASMK